MTENPPQQEPKASPASPLRSERAWDVTQFEIRVTDVWVMGLDAKLDAELGTGVSVESGKADVSGELCRTGEHVFTSCVRWDCSGALPDSAMVLRGEMAVQFCHKPGLPEAATRYYSQVNAPILVFPYIRELIAHITSGSPFGPVVVDPLDVPNRSASYAGWGVASPPVLAIPRPSIASSSFRLAVSTSSLPRLTGDPPTDLPIGLGLAMC